MSPSFWVHNMAILDTLRQAGRSNMRLYMDNGVQEYTFDSELQSVYRQLQSQGWDMNQVQWVRDDQAGRDDVAHNNSQWRRRFPAAYAWLFRD